MNPIRVTLISALVGLLFLTGCGSYEAPSTIQHVYTTSTQDYHQLAGISIEYVPSQFSLQEASAGAVFLSKTWIEYHLDGRLVGKHPLARGFSTFQQIPPGEHELLVQYSFQGAFTFGATKTDGKKRFVFTVAPNQRGKLNVIYGEHGLDDTMMEGVQTVQKIDED